MNRQTGIRPNPNMGSSRYFESVQNTVYASWQSSLRQRFAKNFMGSVHYTWGKALGYTGGDGGANFSGDTYFGIQDFFNWWNDRGPASGDITHNFAGDFLDDLPALADANRIVKGIAGGWQVTGIFSASTGQPLRISQSSSISGSLPDYIGGDPFTPDSGKENLQYFNKDAFARVPIVSASGAPTRSGNLGDGTIRLPGRWNLDFSLGKNFAITEQVKFQFRGDMFNVLNHTDFSAVSTGITAGSFGRFTNKTNARVIQLNARFSF